MNVSVETTVLNILSRGSLGVVYMITNCWTKALSNDQIEVSS